MATTMNCSIGELFDVTLPGCMKCAYILEQNLSESIGAYYAHACKGWNIA